VHRRAPSPAAAERDHRPNADEAALGLTAADVNAIASRVVELLRREPSVDRYVDTTAVAALLGVSGDWVREHAAELGGVRVGDGPKGALRFELRRVRLALEQRRLARQPSPKPRRPGPARRVADVELLPLPDDG
jgi:hypothetical protein